MKHAVLYGVFSWERYSCVLDLIHWKTVRVSASKSTSAWAWAQNAWRVEGIGMSRYPKGLLFEGLAEVAPNLIKYFATQNETCLAQIIQNRPQSYWSLLWDQLPDYGSYRFLIQLTVSYLALCLFDFPCQYLGRALKCQYLVDGTSGILVLVAIISYWKLISSFSILVFYIMWACECVSRWSYFFLIYFLY